MQKAACVDMEHGHNGLHRRGEMPVVLFILAAIYKFVLLVTPVQVEDKGRDLGEQWNMKARFTHPSPAPHRQAC